MDRRNFLQIVGAGGIALTLPRRLYAQVGVGGTRKVLVYNLTMEGWSTLGSGHLGDLEQPLTAEQIRAFTTVTLPYTQDPHGHEFTLTPEQFSQLLLGESVSVFTTFALNHNHEVRISPDEHYDDTPPIEVEIDDTGKPVG